MVFHATRRTAKIAHRRRGDVDDGQGMFLCQWRIHTDAAAAVVVSSSSKATPGDNGGGGRVGVRGSCLEDREGRKVGGATSERSLCFFAVAPRAINKTKAPPNSLPSHKVVATRFQHTEQRARFNIHTTKSDRETYNKPESKQTQHTKITSRSLSPTSSLTALLLANSQRQWRMRSSSYPMR